MENPARNSMARQSLVHAIDKEELLIKKYDHYNKTIKDGDLEVLLTEFAETAREHIELMKSKLQNFDL